MTLLTVDAGGEPAVVLEVRGEVDLATTPVLREVLQPVIRDQAGPLVIDLCDVSFMDSTGVQVLVHTARELKARDRRLLVACREHGQVHRLLALVGLLGTLTVHGSRESAILGGDELIRA